MRKASSISLPTSFHNPSSFLFQPDGIIQVFDHEFDRYFIIDDSTDIRESQRTLYLMCRVQR